MYVFVWKICSAIRRPYDRDSKSIWEMNKFKCMVMHVLCRTHIATYLDSIGNLKQYIACEASLCNRLCMRACTMVLCAYWLACLYMYICPCFQFQPICDLCILKAERLYVIVCTLTWKMYDDNNRNNSNSNSRASK